jgi:hypothetical protein
VAYGDISQLQSAVGNLSAQQMVDTLKSNLDEITFRNVLNFVFGKPLIEPPPPISTESLSGSLSGSLTGTPIVIGIVPAETPDITNALKEYFEKDIPSLEMMIAQKQKELADQRLSVALESGAAPVVETITTTETSTTPAGFTTFVENPAGDAVLSGASSPPSIVIPTLQSEEAVPLSTENASGTVGQFLSPDVIQQLEGERTRKQLLANQLYQDQISLINFRDTLLPLLYAELQRFIQRDLELAAQALIASGGSAEASSTDVISTTPANTTGESPRSIIPEGTVILSSDVAEVSGITTKQQEILPDGTVVVQVSTPTKIFTTSTNVGAPVPSPSPSIMPSLDTTSTFMLQQPMPQNEDVAKLFLGTSTPSTLFVATTPETLKRVPVVLPPPENIPEEEAQNRSEGVLPNFGGSVMTQG